jgi:hypothetical protein
LTTRIQKIENPEQTNHGIVIVYIPMTDIGPFRARGPKSDVEDKYFMRTTSDTLVMPHQILGALFGRRPIPQLRVGIEKRDDMHSIAVHVENIGRGAAISTFVRLKVTPGQQPNNVHEVGSWTDRRRDVVGSGWDLAFAHPANELLYPGESRIAGVYQQFANERTIRVRVDCANGIPVDVTRTVELELKKIEWFPVTEI